MKSSSGKNGLVQLTICLGCFLVSFNGLGQSSIDFSTSTPANWAITAGGAVNATPYSFGSEISVSSTGTGIGTFVPGGSFQNFSGYWVANYTFTLPANATDISLNFSNLTGDDRVVLTLNSTPIAATGIPDQGNSTAGSMVFTDGGSLQPYTFSTPNGSVSGTVTSGFNLGGLNTLQAIVNNTHTGISGPVVLISEGTSNDGTHFGVSGNILFSTVPEPSSVTLILVACGVLALKRRVGF